MLLVMLNTKAILGKAFGRPLYKANSTFLEITSKPQVLSLPIYSSLKCESTGLRIPNAEMRLSEIIERKREIVSTKSSTDE